MKIKIQHSPDGVCIHEIWTRTDVINRETMHAHKKDSGRVIMLAGIFMKMFPRFKEVTVSTKLTED